MNPKLIPGALHRVNYLATPWRIEVHVAGETLLVADSAEPAVQWSEIPLEQKTAAELLFNVGYGIFNPSHR